MSVDMKVVLLVEGDTMGEYLHPYTELGTLKVYTNMYTMVKSTKRWAFTSPKIDKPFGVRFHFENFWEPMSIGMKVILLAGHDNTLYIPSRVWNSWGFHAYVHDGYICTNKKIDSHITKTRRAFQRSVPFFFLIFGNRCRSMRGSYFWLRTT